MTGVLQKNHAMHPSDTPIATQNADTPLSALLTVMTTIANASTTGGALEAAYQFLHREYGLRAMAVEFDASGGTRFQPYGDTLALIDLAQNSSAPQSPQIRVCVWNPAFTSAGRIFYVLANQTEDAEATEKGPCPPEELLEAITAQIALQLSHETQAQRIEAAEDKAGRRISELATIYEIGQAIDQIELPNLLQMITERTAANMDAQACSLMLVQENTNSLRVAASHGLPDEAQHAEQLMGEGIAGRVAKTEQPLLIVGARRDARLAGVNLRPEIGSSMLVPMKNQEGRVLGVLCIRRRRPTPDFTNEDLKLFSAIATQAALALTNVALYADLKRRANELLQISTLSRALISTLDLETLLARVADDICQTVGFERCCVYMRDAKRAVFVPRIWRGYGDSIGRNPVREGEGAIGAVAHDKQMLHFDAREEVTSERERERFYLQCKGYARSLGANAFVAVPLLTGQDRCIGVVVADNRNRREPIAPSQQSLLSAFIYQAGIALENARLVQEMQENYKNIHRLKSYTDSVLQSIGAGIISTDGRGVIARWNRAALETLRLSPVALRDALLTDALARLDLPEDERAHLLQIIARVQKTGERIQRHKLTLHPSDRAPLTMNLMLSRLPESSQESGGVVLIFEDVTQEVRLEAELEKMRRLADIGQLAAKMAHEVRNALSPIKGAAQIIRADLEAQSGSVEWPDIIVAEVDNLSHLTSEMLNFARPTQLNPREVHVQEFLLAELRSLGSYLEENRIALRWQWMAPLPLLVADPHQLGQVVRNLVINATQAMPEGGEILISATYSAEKEELSIDFQDQGVGIPPNDLERVFRPFVTTKPKGTGLGLPIVQKIIDHHGGHVEVRSRMGKGTCFTVALPLRPAHDGGDLPPEVSPLISSRTSGAFPDN